MSKDPLDEIIDPIYRALELEDDGYDSSRDKAKTKQQILTHYISYDEVERLIGKDERVYDSEGYPNDGAKSRNQLRAELKAALKKRRESK